MNYNRGPEGGHAFSDDVVDDYEVFKVECPIRANDATADLQRELLAELTMPFRDLCDQHRKAASREAVEVALDRYEAVSASALREITRRAYVIQGSMRLGWLKECGARNEHPQSEAFPQIEAYAGTLLRGRFKNLVEDLIREAAEAGGGTAKQIAAAAARIKASTLGSIPQRLMRFLSRERQAAEVRLEVDIWATEDIVLFDQPNRAAIKRRFDGLPTPRVDDEALADRVGHDYFIGSIDAFPRMPGGYALLDMVAAARVAADRRNAYCWLQATSNFGKSLLFSVMRDDVKIMAEIKPEAIERGFSGAPSELTPEELATAWGLWFDEFKTVKSELKDITQSMSFAPKGKSKVTVPVYGKFFTSAEDVRGLTGAGGVEKQFANRFSYLDARAGDEVATHPIFKELGGAAYARHLGNFVARYLMAQIDAYKALGKGEAQRQAERALGDFHLRFGIAKTFGDLEDALISYAEDFESWLRRGGWPDYTYQKDGRLVIQRADAAIDEWMKERKFSPQELRQYGYKKGDIQEAIKHKGAGAPAGKKISMPRASGGKLSIDALMLRDGAVWPSAKALIL